MLTTECKDCQREIGCLDSEVCKRGKGIFPYDWSIRSKEVWQKIRLERLTENRV